MRTKAVSAETMSEIDKRAQVEYGISQAVLMENAGRAASDEIIMEPDCSKNERIAVFCGKGNNGGDGFVVARLLKDKGFDNISVFAIDQYNVKRGAAYSNFLKVRELGIAIDPITEFFIQSERKNFSIGIDAIFGTGFNGKLPKNIEGLNSFLERTRCKVFAIDVPSGLNATTGDAIGGCIKAFKTITFGLPKEGFYKNKGPDLCGEIVVKAIGFPESLLKEYV